MPTSQDLLDIELRHQAIRPTFLSEPNLLAIDYGAKFCGLALCQAGISLPLSVVKTTNLYPIVKDLIRTKNIQVLIWGLPLGKKNEENQLCQTIRRLQTQYKKTFGIPGYLVNERYSSKNILTKDPRQRIDDLAALNILEYFLAQQK